jgi:signal transduction histidine kinase
MAKAAQTIAKGSYTLRVLATSRDEVGELARAFNSMAAQLAVVDQQRRDLVANVSHELRTPVSALQALLENLVDGVVPADPDRLEVALAQTERLGRLVADLMDLSRLEAGLTRLAVSDVPVLPLVEEAVREAALAGERPVRYRVEVEPADLVVAADRARLHQLLANLLDTAARHSPAGGAVAVRAYRSNGATVLEVADQGPGISPQDRAAVFERFSTGRAEYGGTGLGLAIARWVVDLHGGRIEVADQHRGCLIRAAFPGGPDHPDHPGRPGHPDHPDQEEPS